MRPWWTMQPPSISGERRSHYSPTATVNAAAFFARHWRAQCGGLRRSILYFMRFARLTQTLPPSSIKDYQCARHEQPHNPGSRYPYVVVKGPGREISRYVHRGSTMLTSRVAAFFLMASRFVGMWRKLAWLLLVNTYPVAA